MDGSAPLHEVLVTRQPEQQPARRVHRPTSHTRITGAPRSQETPNPLASPQVSRHRATAGSNGGGVSDERGTPVIPTEALVDCYLATKNTTRSGHTGEWSICAAIFVEPKAINQVEHGSGLGAVLKRGGKPNWSISYTKPPWRQPRGKWTVSLVNSHSNATSRR